MLTLTKKKKKTREHSGRADNAEFRKRIFTKCHFTDYYNYIFHLKHFDTFINFLKVKVDCFAMFLIDLLLKE